MNKYLACRVSAFTFVAGVFALLLAALSLLPAQAMRVNLPPRPTPQPTSPPTSQPTPQIEPTSWPALAGVASSIELRVRFGRLEQARHWQEYWTVVEWQDALGGWHEVEGWRGTLDEIVDGEGRKVWWMAQKDLGTGPFRWTVYRRLSGGLLARSEPFDLPGTAGQTAVINVALR